MERHLISNLKGQYMWKPTLKQQNLKKKLKTFPRKKINLKKKACLDFSLQGKANKE